MVVAKPPGPTSHDVVALVRRLANTRRVGHGGTLDPFASGVLPVFLGRATRLVEYHLADRKAYRATICFGASSTTDDLGGDLTPASGSVPGGAAVAGQLGSFVGALEQRPPAFSAVKVAGRRAYAMARAGEQPDLPARRVTIHRLDLVSWDETDPERPVAVVDVECSAGTYVRSIARDLGAALGSAAYLGALVRTASGSFTLDDALSFDQLRAAAADDPSGVVALLRPPDAGLESIPAVTLGEEDSERLVVGQRVALPAASSSAGAQVVRVMSERRGLIAMAHVVGGALAPDKVLVDRPETYG